LLRRFRGVEADDALLQYGTQWSAYRAKVSSKFIPYVL
jgi:hypothetical protein